MSKIGGGGGFCGDFFELFDLNSVMFAFSQNCSAESITNRVCVLQQCSTPPPPPLPVMGRPMGELRWAVAHF